MRANHLTTITDQLAALGEIESTYAPLGRQTYVLTPAADLPEYLQPRGSACTGPFLDLNSEPYLRSKGRWQGRGFCVAMSHEPSYCPATWFSLLLHEAGHDIASHATEPRRALYGNRADVCDLSERELVIAMAYKGVKASFKPKPHPHAGQGETWEQHHLHWIRAVCHLEYRSRAWFVGQVMPSLEVGNYVPSTTREYQRLLTDELVFRSTEPISQIVQDRPPRKFEALWRADTGGASCDPRDYSVCDRSGSAAVRS